MPCSVTMTYMSCSVWSTCLVIKAAIAERADQVKNRLRRGSRGGLPPAFDAAAYKRRNVVQRAFCHLRLHRAVAAGYDKRHLV